LRQYTYILEIGIVFIETTTFQISTMFTMVAVGALDVGDLGQCCKFHISANLKVELWKLGAEIVDLGTPWTVQHTEHGALERKSCRDVTQDALATEHAVSLLPV
jgi:hypothetical protein